MHAAYFDTRFRCDIPPAVWPEVFVVLSAYATTGSIWNAERNSSADAALECELARRQIRRWRVDGYSPETGHSEPSWVAEMPVREGCGVGKQFLQDAIYWVERDRLFVIQCEFPNRLVFVGTFSRRLDPCPHRTW